MSPSAGRSINIKVEHAVFAPANLNPADRRIFGEGIAGILKEDHDKLDQAVAAAYSWPADLPRPKSSRASSR